MITMRLLNSPGYPTVNPNYLGTVHRYRDGAFAVGVNADYASTLEVRRYLGGAEPPNYPMPAIPLACAIHPHVVQIAEAYWFEGNWEFDLVYEYPNSD